MTTSRTNFAALSLALGLLLPILVSAQSIRSLEQSRLVRTQIEFSSYQTEGWIHSATIQTRNDISNSQVVIIIRRGGIFSIPLDGNNRPAIAEKTRELGREGTNENSFKFEWKVQVRLQPAPQEIYAIVCRTNSRIGSAESSDLAALRYLNFQRTYDIAGVLRVLSEFGWTPTGYTRLPS